MDPRTPVIVGAAQLTATDPPNEPVDLMVQVARAALDQAGAHVERKLRSVRVVRGINPYADPGALVAEALNLSNVTTGLTQHGGQEAFDLFTATTTDIATGALDGAIVCGAETMRTRRADKRNGTRSDYLPEPDDASPSVTYGSTAPYWDALDTAATTNVAVHFYAMAESARRHRLGESLDGHRRRISELWANAARVAADHPHAVLRSAPSADEIATPSASNRMVADPYPKLMTSNVNVDMGAAIVLCSAEVAAAAGIPREQWVFPLASSGAHDHWQTRTRWDLDRSPAMRHAGRAVLDLLESDLDSFAHVDLYSCFPVAIQVALDELGQWPDADFTITGGLTFNGGPFNTYCLHPLVTAVERIRSDGGRAFLSGNGGFFTKHSFTALGPDPAPSGFTTVRPQAEVDALPARPLRTEAASEGVLEAYTTVFSHDGEASHTIVSVLADDESRHWSRIDDADTINELRTTDAVGRPVRLAPSADPIPTAHLA